MAMIVCDNFEQDQSSKQIRSIDERHYSSMQLKNEFHSQIFFSSSRWTFYFCLFLLLLISQTEGLPLISVSPPSYQIYRHASIPPSPSPLIDPLRRERHRRLMLNRIFTLFDEDANGQFSPDEFYSLALRLNLFPRFHRYLKQTTT